MWTSPHEPSRSESTRQDRRSSGRPRPFHRESRPPPCRRDCGWSPCGRRRRGSGGDSGLCRASSDSRRLPRGRERRDSSLATSTETTSWAFGVPSRPGIPTAIGRWLTSATGPGVRRARAMRRIEAAEILAVALVDGRCPVPPASSPPNTPADRCSGVRRW